VKRDFQTVGDALIAALSASATESSVGGWVVCERSTVKLSDDVLRLRSIFSTSLPDRPGMASARTSTTPPPMTLPE
jgi:hypothetical protein